MTGGEQRIAPASDVEIGSSPVPIPLDFQPTCEPPGFKPVERQLARNPPVRVDSHADPVRYANPLRRGPAALQAVTDEVHGCGLVCGHMANPPAGAADAAIGDVHQPVPEEIGARLNLVGPEMVPGRVACLQHAAEVLHPKFLLSGGPDTEQAVKETVVCFTNWVPASPA